MTQEATISPSNSLILITGKEAGDIPEYEHGKSVFFSPTCMAVSTLPQIDGDTLVLLSDDSEDDQIKAELNLMFSGELQSTEGEVNVCSVLLKPFLTMSVAQQSVNIEVWSNHASEPDKILILICPYIAS